MASIGWSGAAEKLNRISKSKSKNLNATFSVSTRSGARDVILSQGRFERGYCDFGGAIAGDQIPHLLVDVLDGGSIASIVSSKR